MTIVEQRIKDLGLPLPDLAAGYNERDYSGAKFVSHRRHGNLLYLSGTVPWRKGGPYLPGVVGADLTVEEGYEAARWCMLSCLIVLKYALGDLDRVDYVLQMTGWVNSAPGFSDQPRVINGATDLLTALYGQNGLAARAAIGCQGLAMNSSVEIALVVAFKGDEVREPLQTWAARGEPA